MTGIPLLKICKGKENGTSSICPTSSCRLDMEKCHAQNFQFSYKEQSSMNLILYITVAVAAEAAPDSPIL